MWIQEIKSCGWRRRILKRRQQEVEYRSQVRLEGTHKSLVDIGTGPVVGGSNDLNVIANHLLDGFGYLWCKTLMFCSQSKLEVL